MTYPDIHQYMYVKGSRDLESQMEKNVKWKLAYKEANRIVLQRPG